MTDEQQLAWEAKYGRLAAASAVLAVVLPITGYVYGGVGFSDPPKDLVGLMSAVDEQPSVPIISGIISGLGALAPAGALLFLALATRARKPDFANFVLPFTLLGPLVLGAANVSSGFDIVDQARDFLASGPQTKDRATDLLNQSSPLTAGIGLGGALAFGIGVVYTSISAMRVGLLSRLMGLLGAAIVVFAALSIVEPGASGTVLQIFWFGALGFLFVNRWPGGRGPAWDSVRAEPWPSSIQRREALIAERDGSRQPEEGSDKPSTPAKRPKKRKRRS